MIAPSLQENLANSILESLACGIPVVAFDIGGNGDLVKHKINGYLAKSINSNSLAMGIEWTLSTDNYSSLSKNALSIAKKFNYKSISKKYINLYKKVLMTS